MPAYKKQKNKTKNKTKQKTKTKTKNKTKQKQKQIQNKTKQTNKTKEKKTKELLYQISTKYVTNIVIRQLLVFRQNCTRISNWRIQFYTC